MPTSPENQAASPESARVDLSRLLVKAGGCRIALPFRSVREFCEVGRHVSVPGAAAWCLGLVQWRGRLLTLLDAGRIFGAAPSRPRYQVVLALDRVETALAFDEHPSLCGDEAPCDVLLDEERLRGLAQLQPGAAGGSR